MLATNTSSISITKLEAATVKNPERFIGMHFFNPVSMMALVELIRGLQTSDGTHAKVEALAKQLGKDSRSRCATVPASSSTASCAR